MYEKVVKWTSPVLGQVLLGDKVCQYMGKHGTWAYDARPTGDQEVAGLIPTGSATFCRGDRS